jgi:hypothetical protein
MFPRTRFILRTRTFRVPVKTDVLAAQSVSFLDVDPPSTSDSENHKPSLLAAPVKRRIRESKVNNDKARHCSRLNEQ